MEILKFNEQKELKTNYQCVSRDLNHYLSSAAYKSINDGTTVYGLTAWRYLGEYLRNATTIDLRFSRIFMGHRNLMVKHLIYFSEPGVIDNYLAQEYLMSKKTGEKYICHL